MNILLLAAGGHARAVVEAIRASGHTIAAYVDPKEASWLRADRIETDEDAMEAHPEAGFVLGLGGTTQEALETRMNLFQRFVGAGRSAPPVVHPTALVSMGARVDAGTIVLAGAIIQPGAALHAASLVNSGAIVEHDAEVGEGAHIAPGAIILGAARVGAGAMIGAGAVVLPEAEVPSSALVKAQTRFPG